MKKIIAYILSVCLLTTLPLSPSYAKNIATENELAKTTRYMVENNLYDYKLENLKIHKMSSLEKYECVEGLSADEMDKSNIFIIKNIDDSSCDVLVDAAVANTNNTRATGDAGITKTYARIEAYGKLYYNTLSYNGETWYKPTKIAGKINYIPNSARITKLTGNYKAFGRAINSSYNSSNYNSVYTSSKVNFSLTNFTSLQTKSLNALDRYVLCKTDATGYVSGYFNVSYILQETTTGSFSVKIDI